MRLRCDSYDCLIVFLIFLALASQAARFLVVDEPGKSDAIVVLAGETNVRPARALELLRQGVAPHVFLNVHRDLIYDQQLSRDCAEIRERSWGSKPRLGVSDRRLLYFCRGRRCKPMPAVGGRASGADRDLRISHPPRLDDLSPSPAAISVQRGRGPQSRAIRRRLVDEPRMGESHF